MPLFSAGSSHTYHLTPFVLNVITTSLPCILPLVMFLKALFTALYSSSCTLPLSVLRSLPFPLTTNIYADDTQLFFSFHPFNFDSSISYLQNALQQISSWISANILNLNSSKTEFLLIRLENLLAEIHNSLLDTFHSARNLGFIFDEQLTFADRRTSLSLSETCYYSITFVNSAVFGLISIPQLPLTLLPVLFTPSLITVILSLSLNYPVSSRSRSL